MTAAAVQNMYAQYMIGEAAVLLWLLFLSGRMLEFSLKSL